MRGGEGRVSDVRAVVVKGGGYDEERLGEGRGLEGKREASRRSEGKVREGGAREGREGGSEKARREGGETHERGGREEVQKRKEEEEEGRVGEEAV